MPTEAIPLALLASIYPLGLAALILLFQGPKPALRTGAFILGAAACLVGVGAAVVYVERAGKLELSENHAPRYALRLALGVVLLIAAWAIARRPPKPSNPDRGQSRLMRAVNSAGAPTMFAVGAAFYTPSPAYLTALQVVGVSPISSEAALAWVFFLAALVLITVEIPYALFLLAPQWTKQKVTVFQQSLDRRSRGLLVWVLVILGGWQLISGLQGLL
jgi:hypothetical protein